MQVLTAYLLNLVLFTTTAQTHPPPHPPHPLYASTWEAFPLPICIVLQQMYM